jgi:hypothetical protein
MLKRARHLLQHIRPFDHSGVAQQPVLGGGWRGAEQQDGRGGRKPARKPHYQAGS